MKEWTLLDDARILSLLSKGWTRKQIAADFGVTRNAICGRVHRLVYKPPVEAAMPAEDDLPTPNAETIAAFDEIEAGGGEVYHSETEAIFDLILSEPGDAPPTKIGIGSRVVWSAKGRKMLAHFWNRKLPKEGVFAVEELFEWEDSPTTVRLSGVRGVISIKDLELAPVTLSAGQ